jgi:chromosome partitioning protein
MPPGENMTLVFAVANQKGGVAKTTTVHALGSAFAERGRRVLLADLDPQASLTFSLGVDPEALDRSLHEVFVDRVPAADVLLKIGDLHLLPATIDLAGAEVHLLSRAGREYALQRAIDPLRSDYDVVIIDCPPSLGVLTINGLTAANEVLIPLQCETLSQRGVGQLMQTIDDVRAYTNPNLAVRGVIATMFDGRTRLGREILEGARGKFGLTVLEPPVPKSVKVAEAPARGRSVLQTASTSPSAEAYRSLAAQLEPA